MDYIEVTGKTVEEAVTNALIQLETTSDHVEYDVIDKGSNGILGLFNTRPAKIKIRKKFNVADNTREFLEKVFQAMNLEVEISIEMNEEDNAMDIELSGEEMGVLIGKRGQTLDSLQYLTSLVANRESANYIRVKVDTENYRERRKETLENLAKNIAYKVKRTKRSVSLEPMNPYERRVIHSALQNDKYVNTHSEGEEPFRRVVVTLKKQER
jgi:spoIIIJ-associated protein